MVNCMEAPGRKEPGGTQKEKRTIPKKKKGKPHKNWPAKIESSYEGGRPESCTEKRKTVVILGDREGLAASGGGGGECRRLWGGKGAFLEEECGAAILTQGEKKKGCRDILGRGIRVKLSPKKGGRFERRFLEGAPRTVQRVPRGREGRMTPDGGQLAPLSIQENESRENMM